MNFPPWDVEQMRYIYGNHLREGKQIHSSKSNRALSLTLQNSLSCSEE
jgi:hypothetical protein